jgi:hypothetical protein
MTDVLLSPGLLAGCDIDPRWSTGPFGLLKLMPAKAKGKRFEQIAQDIFERRGMKVDRPTNSDHDRIVDGATCEIKGSTITKDSDDTFSFLQIRPQQDYEYLILETFWFDGTVKFHRIPKVHVHALVGDRTFKPQHGGNNGNSGTYCYNGPVSAFDQWYWFEVVVNGEEDPTVRPPNQSA